MATVNTIAKSLTRTGGLTCWAQTLVPPTEQSAGVIRGTARARLFATEAFSFFGRLGLPDVGIIYYESDVEFTFAAPLFLDN